MYRALQKIEEFRDTVPVQLRRSDPTTYFDKAYLKRKFRTKLTKGIRGEAFPQNFQRKIISKMKITLKTFIDEDITSLLEVDIIFLGSLRREFIQMDMDYDGTQPILTDEDIDYLKNLVLKKYLMIRNVGFFTSKLVTGARDCVLSTIVPQKTFMERHIPIPNELFRSLLCRSGFSGIPNQLDWSRLDNLNLARHYWRVFNFGRMNFNRFEDFMGHNRCFTLLINTDGHTFTAHFTRPAFEERPELKPQDIRCLTQDKNIFVDPGRNNAFVAMHGLSSPNHLVPFTTLSTKEYYHLAGFNRTSKKGQEKKRRDFNRDIFRYFPGQRLDNTIQGLESTLPSPKTASVNIFLNYLFVLSDRYEIFMDYYSHSCFKHWKFWNYRGRQKALSEVSIILLLFNLR
jgi:hypothetical protein